MKPIEFLYLDNFRGFEKAIIPFRQVTFLVGENSSGKSSVLAMLNLVRNFNFWTDADFDTDNQHLGGFGDLVTEGSDALTFTIGSARYSPTTSEGKSANIPIITFATFRNLEGLALLNNITIVVGGIALQTFIEGETAYSRTENFDQSSASGELSEDTILKIAAWHEKPDSSVSIKSEIGNVNGMSGGALFHYSLFESQRQFRKDSPDAKARWDYFSLIGLHRAAVWLAPIRTKPRRTYDGTKKAFSSEGDHTPYLLKKELATKASAKRFHKLIGALGRESHLFESIKIRSFGSSEGSPFEVQVKLGKAALSISNVGYGVSQILPILVEIVTRPITTIFHIQQPEVHLHPRAQAALGDLIYLLAKDEQKSFVIETHSDFLIDRYRAAMREEKSKSGSNVDTSVIFFSRKNSRNNALELCLSERGEYPEAQPKEFREFFIQEQLHSLGI